jgi:hypothetical protein
VCHSFVHSDDIEQWWVRIHTRYWVWLMITRMDQSASILSSPGNLLYISFYPTLQASPSPLPNTPSEFVIANSLAISPKAETGKSRYNLRVVETLVGARVLSRILGLEVDPEERATYRQVLERWWNKQGNEDNETNLKDEITALLEGGCLEKMKGKQQDGVLLQEMIEMSGMTEADFHRVFLSWVEGVFFTTCNCIANNYPVQSRPPTSNYTSAPNTSLQKPYASFNSVIYVYQGTTPPLYPQKQCFLKI